MTVVVADCIEHMRSMDEHSVDAVVCDPPYGLEFMGKEWDRPWAVTATSGVGYEGREDNLTLPSHRDNRNANCRACGGRQRGANRCQCDKPKWDRPPAQDMRDFQRWCEAWAAEALRVLKPGGHLLAFGGSRTVHRLASGIEDAGFEIRDRILYLTGGGDADPNLGAELTWLYGSGLSGFPKSLNVTNALAELVPADARCACAHRSTQTVPGSQERCFDRSRPDGGQPHRDGETDLAASPSQAGVPARSRGGQRAGDRDEGPANTCPGEETARPSSGGCPDPTDLPSGDSRSGGSNRSGKASNTSPVSLTEPRKTGLRTPDTSRSASGSAASSEALRNANLPRCPDCSGIVIPEGLGTALKPSHEPVVVARKPLVGTVAANVLLHGTGALNIDGCRVANTAEDRAASESAMSGDRMWRRAGQTGAATFVTGLQEGPQAMHERGRWPANVVLDEVAADLLDEQTGEMRDGVAVQRNLSDEGSRQGEVRVKPPTQRGADVGYGGSGGASRFFYCAKASSAERNAGLDGFEERARGNLNQGMQNMGKRTTHFRNAHPTVKPVELMRWLIRLVTPPGGLVLDPFTGSGTTGVAAHLEGVEFLGIEREAEYAEIARARIEWWRSNTDAGAPTDAVLKVERDPAQLDLLGGEAA